MKTPNLEHHQLPKSRRDAIKAELISFVTAEPETRTSRPKRSIIVATAGIAAIAATGGAVYIATQSVDDQRAIRCFYSTELREENGLTLGAVEITNGDPRIQQKLDSAEERCASMWEQGILTPEGVNPALRDPTQDFDPNNPDSDYPVPELTSCVIDDTVAVIPAAKGICRELNIPKLIPGA